jgi:hypothetical protein
MVAPTIFSDFQDDDTTPDYSVINPDVIRTIVGEGDPAHVASVLANRRAKSGQSYDQLITEPNQFEARTGDSWASNSKIATDDPRYQAALKVAGPILTGQSKPVTSADSFYAPTVQTDKGRSRPEWDDGTGVKGPDGQLYFEGKYSPSKGNPGVFSDYETAQVPNSTEPSPAINEVKPTSPIGYNPHEAGQLAIDLEASKDNPSYPVYDPYNKVGRNADGSIAYVGGQDINKTEGTPGPDGKLVVPITSTSDPKSIQEWLTTHPDDIANKGSIVSQSQGNGDDLAGGFYQGVSNVKNSLEGGLNAITPGHPFNNDLAHQLLNRQANDVANTGSTPYQLGKFGGETVATAPALALPGLGEVEGVGGLANAARFIGGSGGEGSVLLRGASLASKGALQGAEQSALTSAGSNQDFGQRVLQGAAEGGVMAPAFHGAERALQYTPKINDITRDLADKAVNKYGIDLNIPQIKNASGSEITPTVLDKARIAQQRQQFTGALLKDVGATPDEAIKGPSEDVLSALQQRTGDSMNKFAVGKVVNGSGFEDVTSKLNAIKSDLDESEFTGTGGMALKKTIDKILKKNSFTGEDYKTLTTSGTPFYGLQNSKDSNVRQFAGKIRDVLDDAFEGTHNPDEPDFQWGNLSDKVDLDQFRADRLNYKKIMTIGSLANKFTSDGMIDPGDLQGAVNRRFMKRSTMGADNFGELADIGQAFLSKTSPPSLKSTIMSHTGVGTALAAGELGAYAMHSPITAAGALGTAIIAPRLAKSIASNEFLRNRMLRGATPSNPSYFANKFSVPLAVQASQQLGGQ